MLKKVVSSVALASLLFAGQVSLNLGDTFSNKNWNISMVKNTTSYIMLPMDVEYSQLQKSITNDNGVIYVYRWYQRPDLVNADFGINVLGIVKITKNSIIYAISDNGSIVIKDNFDDFKSYLDDRANDISDESKKNIFLNSYVPSFDKIEANKLYLIQVKNMDLNFDIQMPNISSVSNMNTGNNNSSSQSNDNLITPPSVPNVNTTNNN